MAGALAAARRRGELVGVLELVLEDRGAAVGREHEVGAQPAHAVAPARRRVEPAPERGQLRQRQVGVPDLRVALHHVDVAAGGDQLEHASGPSSSARCSSRAIVRSVYGVWARSAALRIGIVAALRISQAVEGAGDAGRARADGVHEEVARAVEQDERGAELRGQVAGVERVPLLGRAVVQPDRVPHRRVGVRAARPSARGSRSSARRAGRRASARPRRPWRAAAPPPQGGEEQRSSRGGALRPPCSESSRFISAIRRP